MVWCGFEEDETALGPLAAHGVDALIAAPPREHFISGLERPTAHIAKEERLRSSLE